MNKTIYWFLIQFLFLLAPFQNGQAAVLTRPAGLNGYFYLGENNTQNYYAHASSDGPITNPLILVTGVEDITESWWPTVIAAQKRGFKNIFIHELRGQGRSERVPGNTKRALHVNRFENYQKDFIRFLRHIKSKHALSHPPLIMAHSTGAPVVISALPEVHQQLKEMAPTRLVLIAPLVRLSVHPLIENSLMAALLDGIEKSGRLLGFLIPARRFHKVPFENNKITRNKSLFEALETIRWQQKLNSSFASLRWGLEAHRATQELLVTNYKNLNVPTLALIAEDDQVVNNDWQIENPEWQQMVISDAQHALHIERSPIFEKVIQKSFKFLLADEE